MPQHRFTVATVLKTGGEFTSDHVLRLWRQVYAMHSDSTQVQFVCLTDATIPHVPTMPLKHSWPGWWSKIELFRGGLFDNHVIYLDLDSTIVGSLEPLMRDEFTMLRDFYRTQQFGSGVMAWYGDGPTQLYENFDADKIRQYRSPKRWGDQGYVAEQLGGEQIKTFGNEVCSFKRDICVNRRDPHNRHAVPDEACVVAFHGKPRPWDVEEVAA